MSERMSHGFYSCVCDCAGLGVESDGDGADGEV